MLGQTILAQLANSKLYNEPRDTGLEKHGLSMTPAYATGPSGPGAPQHDGSPKGDPSVPKPADGGWTCGKCQTKNEDGRIICKGCGVRP